jgi:2-polyprenyl-6-methoxyphenol hydroxylase-like FAD-dependent oxidoreductase
MRQHVSDRYRSPAFIGRRAIVIGGGVAGLAAAGALADYFERVVVLERDGLFNASTPRPGASQGWHAHGLLVGGQVALGGLYPGLGEDFYRAGAVPLRINQDLREEYPDREPMPQRDFGWTAYTMTRPLIESVLRRRALQRSNVSIRQNCNVLGIEADAERRRVIAVWCATAGDQATESIPADLVVDASGRGQLTGDLLQSIGVPRPRETTVGIDLCYTSTVLPIPEDAPTDWKLVLTQPDAPRSGRRVVMLPVEGNRWLLTVAGRGPDRPPAEWHALLDYLQGMPTQTVYHAVHRLRPIGRLARFLFPESVRRQFDDLAALPDGLIPIGDAICRFNPVYGQGMTVAAKQAVLLRHVLGERAALPEPLSGLGQEFLAAAEPLIDTPWVMSALPDFAYPDTRGDRPADLERLLQLAGARSRIAARDAAVQRLVVEVWHMLKPRSCLQDPELTRRVEAEMMAA